MYGGQKAYGKVVCGNSRLVMGTGNFGDDGGVRSWDDELCHFNQMEIGFGDGYRGFQLECTWSVVQKWVLGSLLCRNGVLTVPFFVEGSLCFIGGV